MGRKPAGKLTYADYCAIPEDGLRHEIISGRHVVTPAPETYHQALVMRLGFQLFALVENGGRGRVFSSPIDVELSDSDIIQPDLVVVLSNHEEIITRSRIIGAPDLVVEVLSTSTHSRDRGVKKDLYERCGVPELWIVDPTARLVEQHPLRDGRYENAGLHRREIRYRGETGFTVNLQRIW